MLMPVKQSEERMSDYIQTRVSPDIRALIDQASALAGETMNAYIRRTMAEQARRDVARLGKDPDDAI
jgi:uncharacterized protein (DUF1778 family)